MPGLLCALGFLDVGCGTHQPPASISTSWKVVAAADMSATPAPRKCEDLGVGNIEFDVPQGGVFDFPCTKYAGDSGAFTSGYYDIQAIAFGTSGKVLAIIELPHSYVYGTTRLDDLTFKIP
jgi:hypothetical protein